MQSHFFRRQLHCIKVFQIEKKHSQEEEPSPESLHNPSQRRIEMSEEQKESGGSGKYHLCLVA